MIIKLGNSSSTQPILLAPEERGDLIMHKITINKESEKPESIHASEFDCQAPLRLYEHCKKCARFSDDCRDLKMSLELLLREKNLCYSYRSALGF